MLTEKKNKKEKHAAHFFWIKNLCQPEKDFSRPPKKSDEKFKTLCSCCSEFKFFVQPQNGSVLCQNKNSKNYKIAFLSPEKVTKKWKRFVSFLWIKNLLLQKIFSPSQPKKETKKWKDFVLFSVRINVQNKNKIFAMNVVLRKLSTGKTLWNFL